jgi:hypothetical protein
VTTENIRIILKKTFKRPAGAGGRGIMSPERKEKSSEMKREEIKNNNCHNSGSLVHAFFFGLNKKAKSSSTLRPGMTSTRPDLFLNICSAPCFIILLGFREHY